MLFSIKVPVFPKLLRYVPHNANYVVKRAQTERRMAMKNKKSVQYLIGLTLVALMLLGAASATVFALALDEVESQTAAQMQFSTETVIGTIGSEVGLNISISNNTGVSSLEIYVEHGEEITLSDVSYDASLLGGTLSEIENEDNMSSVVWDGEDGVYVGDGVFLTLTFEISEDAEVNTTSDVRIYCLPSNGENEDQQYTAIKGAVCIIDKIAGDINCDGISDNKDLSGLVRYLSNYEVNVKSEALDTNGDGKTNNRDALCLVKHLTGWSVKMWYGNVPSESCAQHALTYSEKVNATCSASGHSAYWACVGCGKIFTDRTAVLETSYPSTVLAMRDHSYSSSWESDEYSHWHSATCVHSSEFADYAEHTFVNNKCTVCNAPKTFTVTFVDYDGSIISDQAVPYGGIAIAPSAPTRNNYRFIGWNSTFDNVTENLTIVAEYVRQYTVTFKDHDGSTISTQLVDSGENAIPPSTPQREGYTFSKWNRSYENIIANTEVIATYTLNRYTVTFVNVDGSVVATEENVAYSKTVTPPKMPDVYFNWNEMKGYRFTGWKNWDESQPIKSDITITADYSELITDPIIAIDTTTVKKGSDKATVSIHLCGSYNSIYGISLNVGYSPDIVLDGSTIVIAEKIKGAEATQNEENSTYRLSWVSGNGISINKGLTLLTVTFKLDIFDDIGEYTVDLLSDTYIINEDLKKITPIVIVGGVVITQ